MKQSEVAVLGCTGIVGQVFLWLLAKHPWFKIAHITASSSRNQKLYRDEVNWKLPVEMPNEIESLVIEDLDHQGMKEKGIQIVFSALPTEIASTIERELKENNFFVFSNASACRYDEHVPILIPEANMESLNWIEKQGFPDSGFVITNANCSTTGLAVALAPLRKFGIQEIFVSTYQSISGAGYPGLSAMDISGNAIPYIPNEEEKMGIEIKKILNISPKIFPFCVRIPTLFGHLETLWLKFEQTVNISDVKNTLEQFLMDHLNIPSMPDRPIIVCSRHTEPQPINSFSGTPPGYPVWVGRLKEESSMIGFTLVVNNLVKGAAGGSIQNAELFLRHYGDRI